MKLEHEVGKGNYEESHQGKRARYNAPTEETLMNTSNNEQVPAVRVPQNYSQVLQAPAHTHVQMDIDKEGSGMVPSPSQTTTATGNHGKYSNNTMQSELDACKRT